MVRAAGNPHETFVLPGLRRWEMVPAEARCSPMVRKRARGEACAHRLYKEAFALTGRVQFEGDAVSVDSSLIMREIRKWLCANRGREQRPMGERNLRFRRT